MQVHRVDIAAPSSTTRAPQMRTCEATSIFVYIGFAQAYIGIAEPKHNPGLVVTPAASIFGHSCFSLRGSTGEGKKCLFASNDTVRSLKRLVSGLRSTFPKFLLDAHNRIDDRVD